MTTNERKATRARRGVPTITWDEFVERTGSTADAIVRSACEGQWWHSQVRADALASNDIVNYRWIKALDIAQWHYCERQTLTQCGARLDISRQRATQLLNDLLAVYPIEAHDERAISAAIRSQMLSNLYRDAVDIVRVEPGVRINDLAERLVCDVADLDAILGSLAVFVDTGRYGSTRGSTKWTDDELLGALTTASATVPAGRLTIAHYKRLDLDNAPSAALIMRRFGSWNQALAAAGIEIRDRAAHDGNMPVERAMQDMVTFVLETRRTSWRTYQQWAHGREGVTKVPQAILASDHTWKTAMGNVLTSLHRGEDARRFRLMVDGLARENAVILSIRYGADFSPRSHLDIPRVVDLMPSKAQQ